MTIKQQVTDYRNQHKEGRVLLSVVLGEFERVEKSSRRLVREVTDEEATNILKKLIQSNNECKIVGENEILELFLPKQLTEWDIKTTIRVFGFETIGECMKCFKEDYPGRYDGKLVSKFYKEINE